MVRIVNMRRISLLCLAVLALVPATLAAQSPTSDIWDPRGLTMQRDGLEGLLQRLTEVSESSAYSSRVRERAERDAEAIRERLNEGDFRIGDRIVLDVQGESQIPDTLFVESGPQITLPVMGPIPLDGVLRSELESHLTQELSRFIENPVVRARALIRLSIQGSVGSPGFYRVPADVPLGDAIMVAGGPSQTSDLDELRIERSGSSYLQGNELQSYLAEGRTLDQLNLRAGDQIVLPAEEPGNWWSTPLRWAAIIASTTLLGVRVF